MWNIFNRQNNSEEQPRRRTGCLRKIIYFFVFYIAFGAMFAWMFEGMMSPTANLEDNTIYVLKLEGTLVEQGQEPNPFASILSDMPGMSAQTVVVGLDDIKRNLQLAKEDPRILGVLLEGGDMQMGMASAKALRDALQDYQQSGKWLLAYSNHYSQVNYYVASVADKMCLNPVGSVDWNGLSAQKLYYKRLLEKIGIEMQIVKVGTFKSAVEPYIRTSMSEADRKQTEQYVSGLWQILKRDVTASRGIDDRLLDTYADRYMGYQSADMYVETGLIDTLVYVDQMDSILVEKTAIRSFKRITTDQLSLVKRTEHIATDHIAVLYAEGEITDSEGTGIVATKMLKQIKRIAKDDQVKAVVLRVNSPGGSANASEEIWHAVQTLREKGLPVVVSMGDYAASGGYYISCGADYIVAEPNTLTGSIGIFGMVPSLGKLREKAGVDMDGLSTNRHSNLQSHMVYDKMTMEENAIMQQMVEHGYDLFTRRCADGRHTTQEAIKQIAEGRVWLGEKALELGLVDQLGGLDLAVRKAVDMAELTDYQLDYYPKKKDFLTDLIESLENSTEEERLIMKLRTLCQQPRILTLSDIVSFE